MQYGLDNSLVRRIYRKVASRIANFFFSVEFPFGYGPRPLRYIVGCHGGGSFHGYTSVVGLPRARGFGFWIRQASASQLRYTSTSTAKPRPRREVTKQQIHLCRATPPTTHLIIHNHFHTFTLSPQRLHNSCSSLFYSCTLAAEHFGQYPRIFPHHSEGRTDRAITS